MSLASDLMKVNTLNDRALWCEALLKSEADDLSANVSCCLQMASGI